MPRRCEQKGCTTKLPAFAWCKVCDVLACEECWYRAHVACEVWGMDSESELIASARKTSDRVRVQVGLREVAEAGRRRIAFLRDLVICTGALTALGLVWLALTW